MTEAQLDGLATRLERAAQHRRDKRVYYRNLLDCVSVCSDVLEGVEPDTEDVALMDIAQSALEELERRGHEWLLRESRFG